MGRAEDLPKGWALGHGAGSSSVRGLGASGARGSRSARLGEGAQHLGHVSPWQQEHLPP